MLIYIVNLIINIIIGKIIFSSFIKFRNPKKIYLWLTFVQLTLLAGLRGVSVGTDTLPYHNMFFNIASKNNLQEILTTQLELGFAFLILIISNLGGGPQVLIFVTSMIIVGGFLLFISKNSDDVFLCVILLYLLMFYFTSFNVIRQYIATVILLNGYTYIRDKKLFSYLTICFIAFLFHKTAILFIPLFFITFIKWDLKKIIAFLLGLTLMIILSDYIIQEIVYLIPKYQGYLYTNYFLPTTGIMMPVIFFSIYSFISIIFFIAKPFNDKDFVLCYLITSVLIVFTILGITKVSIANRLAWYLSPYLVVIIPKALRYMVKRERYVFTFIILMSGFAYFLYCLSINWQGIVPYVFFWR